MEQDSHFNMKIILYILIFLYFPIGLQANLNNSKIEKITPDLSNLWGIVKLNNSEILVTQRSGKLFKVDVFKKKILEIKNLPEVIAKKQGGLLDIEIKKTSEKLFVYICFSKPEKNKLSSTAIVEAELSGSMLIKQKIIFKTEAHKSSVHFGCRLLINNNSLYATLGDRGNRKNSQNPKNYAGSTIKLSLPQNSIINKNTKSWEKNIFSIGHRNSQGMAMNPNTGEIWQHEHGPKGGDEINIIKKEKNYGWPIVTHGKEYWGGQISNYKTKLGYEDPVWVWIPSIAPSGMVFYDKEMFKELNGSLLVGSLKFRRIYKIELEDNLPAREEIVLDNKLGRIRDIEIMDDGSLIIINDEVNGGVYRIYN